MSWPDILLLAAVIIACVGVFLSLIRKKRAGNSGCGACPYKNGCVSKTGKINK